jgi:hypothetical protein
MSRVWRLDLQLVNASLPYTSRTGKVLIRSSSLVTALGWADDTPELRQTGVPVLISVPFAALTPLTAARAGVYIS